MTKLPLFARQFLFDAGTTFVGLVIALNLAIPGSLQEAKAQGLVVLSALGSAVAGAFVRNWPAVMEAIRNALGLEPVATTDESQLGE